jgi:tRNA (cytidine/uridine-2'-O-)-methyltransferase
LPLRIVLYRPEIPPNTGNISRLCVGIRAELHIVEKPAFDLSEKSVRRAGLDHWDKLMLFLHPNWDAFFESVEDKSRVFLITKFGKTLYTNVSFGASDYLVFGSETSGLPEFVHNSVPAENKLHIPMLDPSVRSLNLSNSVAILAYEALRQIGS